MLVELLLQVHTHAHTRTHTHTHAHMQYDTALTFLLQDGGMVRKDYTNPPHHTMTSDTRLDQPSVMDQPSMGNFAAFGAPRERSKIPHSMLGLVYWSTSWTDPDARRDEKVVEEETLRQRGRDIGITYSQKSTL